MFIINVLVALGMAFYAAVVSLVILLLLMAGARAEPGRQTMGFTCIDVQYVMARHSWKSIDSFVAMMSEDDKTRALQCLTRSQQAKLRARYAK